MAQMQEKRRILVIRLGALGDLVMCFQAFADLRAAYPGAEIALLTRAPYAAFAARLPWFDKVIVDPKAGALEWGLWRALVAEIRRFAPDRVYDLQGKRRQTVLYGLLGGPWFGPEWSGAAPGCALPRPWPPQADWHFADFIGAQLRAAGVGASSPVETGFFDAEVMHFALPAPYVVLVPGCSPGALHKRWPAASYARLAKMLRARGMSCVLVGGRDEAEVIAEISGLAPECLDLSGRTSLFELAGVLRRAAGVIGNDTGPIHIAAAVGAPTLALLSGRTRPVWSRPLGPRVAWRQSERIEDLSVGSVLAAFDALRGEREGKAG